jgi:flagellar export protein FliJ
MTNKFPLDMVLTLRRNEETSQALKLEALKEKRRCLLEQLDEVKLEIEQQGKLRPERSSAYELASGQKYCELLYRRGVTMLLEIEKAAAREVAQRKVLLAALIERKKIDKLKELWADKRARAESKAEAREMDETARFQFSREA